MNQKPRLSVQWNELKDHADNEHNEAIYVMGSWSAAPIERWCGSYSYSEV